LSVCSDSGKCALEMLTNAILYVLLYQNGEGYSEGEQGSNNDGCSGTAAAVVIVITE